MYLCKIFVLIEENHSNRLIILNILCYLAQVQCGFYIIDLIDGVKNRSISVYCKVIYNKELTDIGMRIIWSNSTSLLVPTKNESKTGIESIILGVNSTDIFYPTIELFWSHTKQKLPLDQNGNNILIDVLQLHSGMPGKSGRLFLLFWSNVTKSRPNAAGKIKY